MSEVSSIHGSTGPVSRPQSPAAERNGVIAGRADVQRDPDRVELSDRARLINRLRELPEVRTDRVEAARQAIADPDFANDDRLNVAIERLLDDLELDSQLG